MAEPAVALQAPDERPVEIPQPPIDPVVAAPVAWHPVQLALFRIWFPFVLLTVVPFPLGSLPFTDSLTEGMDDAVNRGVAWAAVHLLRFDTAPAIARTGSGDKLIDWVNLFLTAMLSLAIALVWTLLDRRREHRRLLRALGTYTRFYVGAVLLSYGFVKVFPSQFQPIGPFTLTKTYGSSSPMNILWTFMSVSMPYTVFTGFAEVLPGLLLLFRRTATLGALLAVAVFANVAALNYAYDVPVKIFSTQLVIFSAFVASLEARRLLDLFVLNRAVPPAGPAWSPAGRGARIAWLAAGALLIAGIVTHKTTRAWTSYTTWGAGSPKSPLYGLYEVEKLSIDGKDVPRGVGRAWRTFAVHGKNLAIVTLGDDRRSMYRFDHDEKAGKLSFFWGPDTKKVAKGEASFVRAGPDHFTLDGTVGKERVSARLKFVDPKTLPLFSRGFNWVNEVPYNR